MAPDVGHLAIATLSTVSDNKKKSGVTTGVGSFCCGKPHFAHLLCIGKALHSTDVAMALRIQRGETERRHGRNGSEGTGPEQNAATGELSDSGNERYRLRMQVRHDLHSKRDTRRDTNRDAMSGTSVTGSVASKRTECAQESARNGAL